MKFNDLEVALLKMKAKEQGSHLSTWIDFFDYIALLKNNIINTLINKNK